MPGGIVLSHAEFRSGISAALDAFIGAVQSHPQLQAEVSQGRRHLRLSYILDFAMRTKYILSEMDNIEAGRPVRYPQQIKNYEFSANPSPQKVQQHMLDILVRSLTLDQMVNGEAPYNFGDWGEGIKSKAKVLVDSLDVFY
ncbi:hypothetical protein QBC37DRAFT_84573 [Rhypophila decipiens]|uniref:Uncharacterized protein n=1 Tax=Rhypophila decipiens TaxID=261697 RepID=A0AAN7BD81_9PEZI|nr:hypothetical protein QBC37DRAFT_84573 [Rhypophila decipiens]